MARGQTRRHRKFRKLETGEVYGAGADWLEGKGRSIERAPGSGMVLSSGMDREGGGPRHSQGLLVREDLVSMERGESHIPTGGGKDTGTPENPK